LKRDIEEREGTKKKERKWILTEGKRHRGRDRNE
jgi:hypothetical protein